MACSSCMRCRTGLSASVLVALADGAGDLVDELDLQRKGIAEEAGDPQGDVDAGAAELGQRHDLEPGDAAGSRLPLRPGAEQRQSLGDVVAAGAHVRGAPDGERHGRRVAAVVLEMAGEQRLGGAAAKVEGGGGRHRPVVERIEIAPGGQDIEPTAARRAGGPGRDEAAGKAGEQGGDLAAAAGP